MLEEMERELEKPGPEERRRGEKMLNGVAGLSAEESGEPLQSRDL